MAKEEVIEITENDIQFECLGCYNILIVDSAGVGLELTCSHCGAPVVVPAASTISKLAPGLPPVAQPEFDFSALSAGAIAERGKQVESRLKENQSQRTEIQSYINKATIELHRWQLQLNKLDSKNQELRVELSALKSVS